MFLTQFKYCKTEIFKLLFCFLFIFWKLSNKLLFFYSFCQAVPFSEQLHLL